MAAVQPKDYFPGRLNARSDFNIMRAITEKLSKQNKVIFNRSCFGLFMKMLGNYQFQGQLYLHLIFKQDKSTRDGKLVFHVNNSEIEFGPMEFALITGLQFGSKPAIPSTSRFFKKVWGTLNPDDFNVQHIEDAFADEKHKGDGEVCLKLALLWVLYGILLPNDKLAKRVDINYIHLVDNLDDFNKYPWGLVGYEMLVKNTRKCMTYSWWPRKSGDFKKIKGQRKQIDLWGFPYALQFWSYEAIPIVATFCGNQISKDVIPRMLRWEAPKFHRFETLTLNCFPDKSPSGVEMKLVKNLIPSPEEQKTTHYKSVIEWLQKDNGNKASSTPTCKRRRSDAFDEDYRANMSSPERGNCDSKSSYENVQLNELIGDVHKLNVKQNKIEHKLDRILENQKVIMTKLGCFTEDDEIKMLQIEGADDNVTEGNDTEHDDYAQIDAYTPSDDETPQNKVEMNVDPRNNPVSNEFPTRAKPVFMKWLMNKSSRHIRVSVGDYRANREWFNRIWDPRGWLCNENMDALMYLVVYKAKKWPTHFKQGWTVVDLMFWAKVTGYVFTNWIKESKKERANFDWSGKEKYITEYVFGRYPLYGHLLPWSEAQRVYGIAHVNQNHWVLYEICIVDEVITVYDSLSGGGRRPNPKHMAEFRKLAMLMPSIHNMLIKNGESDQLTKCWEVKFCPDTPQQNDTDSCGVFCIKMLECLACGRPINEIHPDMSDDYRKKYCFELWSEDNISLIG